VGERRAPFLSSLLARPVGAPAGPAHADPQGEHLLRVGFAFLAIGVFLAQGSRPLFGQEQPAAGPPELDSAEPQPAVEELPPLHLFDKEGILVPVPGITLEEFQRLLILQGQMEGRQSRPRFSLQSLSADGVANERQAEIEFRFQVLVNSDDWVRVPLRLAQGVLTTAPEYEGEGDYFLDFNAEEGGHDVWVHGPAGSTHQVKLRAIIPCEANGNEIRLRVAVPRASVSELRLEVPAIVEAKVVSGGVLAEPSIDRERGVTQLTVRRLERELDLTWWKVEGQPMDEPADLEAVGQVAVRIDGRSVRWNAAITLRSLAGEFDRVLIQLPAGAELKRNDQLGYTVTLSPDSPDSSGARQVLVTLERPTLGPAEIRLTAERATPFDSRPAALDLAGFAVAQAVRQWGHVAVNTVGDWEVVWESIDSGLRRVEDLPEPLRRDDLNAGFEYSRQPYQLLARIVPRSTRISVEPEYLLQVGADTIHLTATCKYTIRGAKAYSVELDLPDWTIDDLGPANLVNLDSVVPTHTNPLNIPLLQPATGQFEITVRAQRRLPAEATSLEVPLPRPRGGVVGPAALIVLPDDNIELRPRIDAMSGLSRQPVAPKTPLPARQQPPQFYRAEEPDATYMADFTRHDRSIETTVRSQVTFAGMGGNVEQRFQYFVRYEPISVLEFDAPRVLAESDSLALTLDGQAVAARLLNDGASRDDARRVQVELPSPRIGALELVARFSLPPRDVPPGTSTNRSIELIMPRDGSLKGNALTVLPTRGISVKQRGDDWRPATSHAAAAADGELRLTSDKAASAVELVVEGESGQSTGTVTVEKAWIQSWLTDSGRIDRAVYRFMSSQSRVEVELPSGANSLELIAQLNGRTLPPAAVADRTLTVTLPAGREDRWHLLELRYRFAGRPPRGAWLTLESPRWPESTWLQQTYWQVVLPPNEHQIAGAADWTPEHTWMWSGMGWRRVATRGQADLEAWTGTPERSAPPDSANQYLFSSLQPGATLRVRTADRALIVFTASLCALVVGLLLIYLPGLRRTGILLSGATALIAAALAFPDPAAMLLQAAALGVTLAAAAAGLERMVSRRRGRQGIIRRSTGSSIERRSGEFAQRGHMGPPTSTVTAAAEVAAEGAP
jgi:hypothetical protein